jgi:signal transduction histidine kinase
MASHELRTPLTAVSGFIQVARRRITRAAGFENAVEWKEEAGRTAETLEQAQRQSRRLGRLVDELLDVSRLQLGRVELHQREIDLFASLGQVLERIKLMHTTHTFQLEAIETPAPVLVDQDRMDQVFENLLGNAVKYSPSGGTVAIRVAIDGGEAHVSIADQGIGISADELNNVFNLFYRSPDPRAGHVGGLGLGLYISREIVTRHGGRMWAESSGNGSTFHVVLPLADATKPEEGPPITVRGGATRG